LCCSGFLRRQEPGANHFRPASHVGGHVACHAMPHLVPVHSCGGMYHDGRHCRRQGWEKGGFRYALPTLHHCGGICHDGWQVGTKNESQAQGIDGPGQVTDLTLTEWTFGVMSRNKVEITECRAPSQSGHSYEGIKRRKGRRKLQKEPWPQPGLWYW